MKISNVVIGKENVTQVFLGAEEAKTENIKEEINELRNGKNRVVVFVGGYNEIMASIKAMLQLIVSK